MDDRDIRWQAVERAYREHADDVYRIAFAILRDPDAAGDATQDTFARAFDRWDQYDAHRPLRAWLHGIVSHAALDALRRRRVRVLALPVIGQVREIAAGRDLASDPADAAVERDRLAAALGDLKPDVRAALVLRHYYGYDYSEIAGFLRTSPGNVGSILSRAHVSLRARLTQDVATSDDHATPTRAAR